MGGEFLPLHPYRVKSIGQFFSEPFSGHEVPMTVRVQGFGLSLTKSILVLILVVIYMLRVILLKHYLEFVPVSGVVRLQLQHPVQGRCNPLDAQCKRGFKGPVDLEYCSQFEGQGGAKHKMECEYYDAFDLDTMDNQQDSIMIVTRRSTYKQKLNPLCMIEETKKPCEQKFVQQERQDRFVADVESFTLLVDHAVYSTDEELELSHRAEDMVGFYKPCYTALGKENKEKEPPPVGRPDSEGRELMNLRSALHREEHKICQMVPILPLGNMTLACSSLDPQAQNKTIDMWKSGWLEDLLFIPASWLPAHRNMEHERRATKEGLHKIHNGDVLKVGTIMEELDVDLDQPLKTGKSLRVEGFVLLIDILYQNAKTYTWPNQLPTIYTYHFQVASASEFKAMSAEYDADIKTRIIDNRHGIKVVVKQRGKIGKFSWRECAIILFEGCALYSLVRFVINCYALNHPGKQGDQFEEELIKNVKFGGAEGLLLRGEDGYKALSPKE